MAIYYRKKPVVIEAEQWFPGRMIGLVLRPGDNHAPLRWFDEYGHCYPFVDGEKQIGWIGTLEGGHVVRPGDFIITGVKGEKYPCRADIFEMTYEKVED
jgi:hypothetical protein